MGSYVYNNRKKNLSGARKLSERLKGPPHWKEKCCMPGHSRSTEVVREWVLKVLSPLCVVEMDWRQYW